MSATLGHIKSDILNPLIERCFNMLIRDGQLPEPPQAVLEGNQALDIIYLGPLAKAQQADEVVAIERTMMAAAQVAEVFPEALDVINAPEGIREIAMKLNAPASMINDEKEVKAIQDKRKADMAAMQEAAQRQAEGEADQAQGAGQQAMEAPPQ